jgi:predicted nucleotidyltransferase
VLGKKRVKTVSLKVFNPKTDVIWDRAELGRLVKEFEGFWTDQWEEGKYLKIE